MDGFIEAAAGLLVAVAGSRSLYHFAVQVTAPELAAHAHTAHIIRHGAAALARAPGRFVIAYLLSHGTIKLALAINLLLGKAWIFPVASAVLLGFIGYMAFRLNVHWSGWVLAFMLFDVLALLLVLNEWRRHNSREPSSSGQELTRETSRKAERPGGRI